MEALDFFVVMDHFMRDTVILADIVLPAAIFLNRNELWDASSILGVPIVD